MMTEDQKTLAALKYLMTLVKAKLLGAKPHHRDYPAYKEFEQIFDILKMLTGSKSPVPGTAILQQIYDFWTLNQHPGFRYWSLTSRAEVFKKQSAIHLHNLKIACGMKR